MVYMVSIHHCHFQDLRIYNEEKSEIRSLEKKFKKELELAEREKRLEYELIGKHERQMEVYSICILS